MLSNDTSILLFKTNIQTDGEQQNIRQLLDKKPEITQWTIDTEDIDCVLRIVSKDIHPTQIITEITALGFECAELE